MIQIFVVFHKKIYDECYEELPQDVLDKYFTFIAANETIQKDYTQNKYKIINEWELPIYKPHMQKLLYNENSALYHVYANKLYEPYSYIGFFQYDMKFSKGFIEYVLNNIDENKYLPLVVHDFDVLYNTWGREYTTVKFIANDYADFFRTKFTFNNKYPLLNTFILPTKFFSEKMMPWISQLYDKIWPWAAQPPNQSHPGHFGGILERVSAMVVGEHFGNSYALIDEYSRHDHKYKFDFDIEKDDIITQKSIQSFVGDLNISTRRKFREMPDLEKMNHEVLFIDSEYSPGKRGVFIYSEFIQVPEQPIKIENRRVFIHGDLLPAVVHIFRFYKCTVYIGNSDFNIDDELHCMIDCKVYAQNNASTKFDLLPIGVHPCENLDDLYNVIYKRVAKINRIFFNFSVHPQRQECYDVLKNHVPFVPKFNSWKEYIESLASYKYSICPCGNGYDSHRIWESLYLGVVPICLKTPFSLNLKKYLEPENTIILVDKWEDVLTMKLPEPPERVNYKKLKLSYLTSG